MDENRVSVPADPGGAMLFVFSMEVISFWAIRRKSRKED